MNTSLVLGLSLCIALILVVGFLAATSRRRPHGSGDPGGYWSAGADSGHGHSDCGSSGGDCGGGDGGSH